MAHKQPIARRIVTAFVLMTAAVGGLFAIGIVATVHTLESHLVSMSLDGELQRILKEQLSGDQAPRLPPDTRFLSFAPEAPLPVELRELEDGFTELILDGRALFVYQRRINDTRYILLQDQQYFEQRERALFSVVAAGFILTLLMAWGLGQLLARRVIAPIISLAGQVEQQSETEHVRPLAEDYADDEVGQLARRFDSSLENLRQALSRERLFTGDLSHELRTPLMVISSTCELLIADATLSERQRGQLHRILNASQDMREQLQVLLALARGTLEPDLQSASLAEIAEAQIKLWRPQLEQKQLRFKVSGQAGRHTTFSSSLLAAVISNLLRNALHYTEQGEVRLVLEEQAFSVEDTGPGIPAQQQATLFSPFVRGEGARGEGLGLGLSLVRRICEQQGWHIAYQPLPEGGSCFRVELAA